MSNLDENLTTEYLYSEPLVQVESRETQKGTGAYRFLAVFFFLIAAGGLFLGMLSTVWEVFSHAQMISVENPTSILSNSLLGELIIICGSFEAIGNGLAGLNLSSQIWFITDVALIFLAAFAALFALILMIISLCTKTKSLARSCALSSGIIILLTYGGLFLLSFFSGAVTAQLKSLGLDIAVAGTIDVPAAVIAGIAFLALSVTAIARRKIYGFLSMLLFVLTVISITMLNYPTASLTMPTSFMVFDLYGVDLFVGIAMTLLVVMLGFNFVTSALRLNAKKKFAFDAVRFAIQLFAVLLAIVAFMVSAANASSDLWAIFTAEGQTLATVLLLVCSIAAFIVALLATILKKKQTETIVEVTAPEQQAATVYEQPYLRVSPYEAYAPVMQPVYMSQPQVIPVQPQVVSVQPQVVPVQQPIQVQVQQPQPQPQPQPQSEPQKPSQTNIYVQQAERPDIPVTEFERRMQALARGETPVYDAKPVSATQQKQEPEQPAYGKGRKAKRRSEETNNSYVYEGSQYVYDPFIKTLTPQERNEFGDLFIANIYGLHSYLPTYVIGGDNKMFFDRVFIYLGSYRHYISQDLLEKIYLYVSKL